MPMDSARDFSGPPPGFYRQPPREASLVSRCVSGDATAWRELVLSHQKLIYSVARLHFRDPAAADDIFQDVCVELYRRLDTIRDLQALPAWLVTVTRRKCAKALRERSAGIDPDAGDPATLQRGIATIENRFWLEQALERLSQRDHALIEALYLDPEEPSYSEIARRLDMPVSSIGPTRARCLEKLRRHWERAS